MLEAQGIYNHLSNELRSELEETMRGLGRIVTYKFAIAKINPDGEQKTGGKYLYPLQYSLTPVTYDIIDPYDKKRKKIGLVKQIRNGGTPNEAYNFFRLVVKEGWSGMYKLDLNKPSDQDVFAWLEMHPKLEDGKFRDPMMPAIVKRINLVEMAKQKLQTRSLKADSMYLAANMPHRELMNFASAMGWDETEEEVLLREKIVDIAEADATFFRDFINDKNIEYRAVLKRAMDAKIIAWLPAESKFVWCANNQPFAVLERAEGNTYMDRMCDWFVAAKNGQEVFEKIKKVLSGKSSAV